MAVYHLFPTFAYLSNVVQLCVCVRFSLLAVLYHDEGLVDQWSRTFLESRMFAGQRSPLIGAGAENLKGLH